MLPDGRRLGIHLPVAGGPAKAVERAHAIGASAIQVFGDNPSAWRRRPEPSPELDAFRARLAELDIGPVAIHAPYLVNLAGSDHSFYEKSIEVLAHELQRAPGFGARYVNVHTGSHRGAGVAVGIERIADGCAMVLSATEGGPDATQLVLENSAGSGAAVGVTVEELAAIADACDRRGIPRERLGFCLDTAHLWGAGVRVSEPNEIDALLAAFEARIGLDRLAMMHLNDSKSELGSRLDRHEHIGAGRIGPRGMAHFLTHPWLRHVPTYLETPGMEDGYDAVNMRRALDLAAGRRLAPLPPGAMNLPPRRGKRRPAPEPA